jgi:hypothetical protein
MVDDIILENVKKWRDQVTVISRNLMELAETESVKTVRGRLKDQCHPFARTTRVEAEKSSKTLDGLWEAYAVLNSVIEEAYNLANKNGFFHDNSERISELLEKESVTLPTEHIPITSRGLLARADKVERVTPQEMLDSMQDRFCEARDSFLKISDAITQTAPRLSAMGHEADTLKAWAKTLGVDIDLPDTITAIAGVDSDPLSLWHDIDRLEAELLAARTALQKVEDKHHATLASLDEARTQIEQLRDLIQRSTTAISESHEKILSPEGLVQPASPESIDSLAAWLKTLDETAAAGRFKAVNVGLSKFVATLATVLSKERSAYAANRSALDERADIKGRFGALCAKADAFVSKGVVLDGTIASMRDQAKQLLDVRQLDLKAARRSVGAFETALLSVKR